MKRDRNLQFDTCTWAPLHGAACWMKNTSNTAFFFFLLSVIFLFTDEFFRGETLISVLPERNDVVLSLHRIRQALQKPRKSAYFQIEFNRVERANYSSACSSHEADRICSPRIDLEVMGLRLTTPVEIRSATPTRQHVTFEVRISAYPVALIEICAGVALRFQFLE